MSDILTMRVHIKDKLKADWIWELMRVRLGIKESGSLERLPDLGVEVHAISWGDEINEKEYVLERIGKYLSRWDRDDLREKYKSKCTDRFASLEELEELIEIWEKEAREKYGSQVTVQDLKDRAEKNLQLKLRAPETRRFSLAEPNQSNVPKSGTPEGKADSETGG